MMSIRNPPLPVQARMVLPGALVGVFIVLVATLTVLANTHSQVLLAVGPTALNQAKPQATVQVQTTQTTHATTTTNASQAVVRIDQTDPGQYASQQDYQTWSPSTCSAASMTEVINSYGHHYKLADILKVEAGLGEITPESGLLSPNGIDKTVSQFGFQTRWLQNPSLDDLINTANSGTPVIINFPPSRWAGGHFLVATGGDKNYVYLTDSSRLNMRAMDHQTFLKYWAGLAVVVTPAASTYSVLGSQTLSADFINHVLKAADSPAQGKGQALYDLGVKYGINAAFALAFYQHESDSGQAGEANTTRSLGNLRCIPDAACWNTTGQQCQPNQSCYAAFPTWEAGFEAWYKLIRNLYITSWGLTTIDQIIPKYAPPTDGNNDDAYIAALKKSINQWATGTI